MGELGEYWRAHQEYKRGCRERAREKMPSLIEQLALSGYEFTRHNGGEHIRINVNGQFVDWWPSTCRWMHGKKVGFKFKNLQAYLSKLRGDDLDVPF